MFSFGRLCDVKSVIKIHGIIFLVSINVWLTLLVVGTCFSLLVFPLLKTCRFWSFFNVTEWRKVNWANKHLITVLFSRSSQTLSWGIYRMMCAEEALAVPVNWRFMFTKSSSTFFFYAFNCASLFFLGIFAISFAAKHTLTFKVSSYSLLSLVNTENQQLKTQNFKIEFLWFCTIIRSVIAATTLNFLIGKRDFGVRKKNEHFWSAEREKKKCTINLKIWWTKNKKKLWRMKWKESKLLQDCLDFLLCAPVCGQFN